MKAWKEQRKLPWAIVALVSFGLFVVYAARNPSQFYRLDSIIVTSEYTTPGKWQTRIMRVARHISQSFEGKYQVEEFAVLKNGRLRVKSCGSPEWILYVPDAVLPDPLEVGWWAWGDCSALGDVRTDPAGVYQMCTRIHIKIVPFLPWVTRSTPEKCSPPYQGRAILKFSASRVLR